MPQWVQDHSKWDKAKALAQKSKKYQEMKKSSPDRFFSIVTNIYKDIGGRIEHEKKRLKKG